MSLLKVCNTSINLFLISVGVPANSQIGLVVVSKVLNDLALNSVDKQKHPLLAEFIQKNRPILLSKVSTLIVSVVTVTTHFRTKRIWKLP